MNSDIESLMSQYLDGRVTAAEAAELSRHLIENPEAAARFAELTRMDEGLRVALKAESRSAIFSARLRGQAEKQSAKSTTPDRRRWLAAAAGLAVLGGTAWWFSADNSVPTLVMDWAKSRVKRNSGGGANAHNSGDLASTDTRGSLPVDRAADLRRKLRNFAIPYLHMRSMPVSDALNTLALQWTSLPHVRSEDAEKVKIALADSTRKRWPRPDQEPRVSVDIPNLSLHTALNLVAAQAGLSVDITGEAVTLLPDESAAQTADAVEGKPEEPKTWTFPLVKPVADTFLASLNRPQAAPGADASKFMNLYAVLGRDGNLTASRTAAPEYFSYAQAGSAPANISGAAGAGPAEAVSLPQVDWSFSHADLAANSGQTAQKAAIEVLSETLDTTAMAYTADRAALHADGSGPQAESELLLQQSQADSLTRNDAVVVYDFDLSPTFEERPAVAGVPLQAQAQSLGRDDFLAQNDPARERTIPGVESVQSADAPDKFYKTQTPPAVATTADGAVRLNVTRLRAEQSNLQEIGYDWMLGTGITPTNSPPSQTNEQVLITSRFVQSDPQLISGLTYFVKPAPPTLDSWLTGLSGGGTVAHDTENGTLSVTGSPAELRTAAAAVAAINESVQWGVSVDVRYVELGDLPAPEISGSGAPTMASAEVEKLCKAAASTPGSTCVRLPALPGALEKAALLKIENGRSFVHVPTNSRPVHSSPAPADAGAAPDGNATPAYARHTFGDASRYPDLFLEATVTAAKQGERWTLTTTMKDGSSELNNKASFMDGSWLVLEGSKGQGRYLLLRPRSANIGS